LIYAAIQKLQSNVGDARNQHRRRLPATMAEVLDPGPRHARRPLRHRSGRPARVSRATAHRYLADLVRRGLLDLSLNRTGTGRPEHRYGAKKSHPGPLASGA